MITINAATVPSAGEKYGAAFWERMWRSAGIQSAGLFVLAWVLNTYQPHMPVFAVLFGGLAVLNLMWFTAAIRATLAGMGQDGWGGAVTASSAATGGFLLLLLAVSAALTNSIANFANPSFASGLEDFGWSLLVLSSFPRAMLIMSGSFGLWRAKAISNGLFAIFVAAVILVLAGGTTWFGGAWAPDGLYSRFISPTIGLIWLMVVSRVVLSSSPARAAW